MPPWRRKSWELDRPSASEGGPSPSSDRLTVGDTVPGRHPPLTGIIPSQAGWNKGDSQKLMTNFGTPRNTATRVKAENLQVGTRGRQGNPRRQHDEN